jgi:hypothetical protein
MDRIRRLGAPHVRLGVNSAPHHPAHPPGRRDQRAAASGLQATARHCVYQGGIA